MKTVEEQDVALKILHTADWHLGLRYPSFGEEDGGRFTRARIEAVDAFLESQKAIRLTPCCVPVICSTRRPRKSTGGRVCCGCSSGGTGEVVRYFCCREITIPYSLIPYGRKIIRSGGR